MSITFYLRNDERDEILAEATITNNVWPNEDYTKAYPITVEVSATVDLHAYSCLLLHTPADKQSAMITDFDFLSRLAWWYHDEFRALPKTDKTYQQSIEWVRQLFAKIANKYNLTYYEN